MRCVFQGRLASGDPAFYSQLCILIRVTIALSTRCFVTPPIDPSWSRFFEEFHCRGCGGQEAYRSRARGFFERYVLPLLLLQPVRCERCYHRSYIFRTIPAIERVQVRKQAQSQAGESQSDVQAGSKPGSRVA